jgi:hypothetical protein
VSSYSATMNGIVAISRKATRPQIRPVSTSTSPLRNSRNLRVGARSCRTFRAKAPHVVIKPSSTMTINVTAARISVSVPHQAAIHREYHGNGEDNAKGRGVYYFAVRSDTGHCPLPVLDRLPSAWTHPAPSMRVATFPLQPNQMPVLSLSAALTATSSPPARAFAFFSGMATLFETMTSCPNSGPLRNPDWPSLNERAPATPSTL